MCVCVCSCVYYLVLSVLNPEAKEFKGRTVRAGVSSVRGCHVFLKELQEYE